jgi:Ca2+-binding RTX toxin-like protein
MDDVFGGSDPPGVCCSSDSVNYPERWNPLSLSIDGSRNDGEAGELDYIGPDAENLQGGSGNDTLIGDAHGNTLWGVGATTRSPGSAATTRWTARPAWTRSTAGASIDTCVGETLANCEK